MSKKDWPVSALIPDEDFQKLCDIGRTDQRSIAWIIRKSIREYLERHANDDISSNS